jgi:hypothetical protein
LDQLRDRIAVPSSATAHWNQAKDDFLATIKHYILLEQVITQDVSFERATSPNTHFKSKLRAVFTNRTGEIIEIGHPIWHSNSEVSARQNTNVYPVQLEDGLKGWETNKWLSETKSLLIVPPNSTFRTWIGLVENVPDWELRRKHTRRQVGTLEIPIKVNGASIGAIKRRV